MVLVATVALGLSTYAWFVTNTKVTAGTAEVSAATANTLPIKNENNDWAKDTDNKITVNKVSAATGNEYWIKDFEIKTYQTCKLYLDTETAFNVTGENNSQ